MASQVQPRLLASLTLPRPVLPPPSPQVRILEVLLSVHDRQARADMLPEAFTPPSSSAGAGRTAEASSAGRAGAP